MATIGVACHHCHKTNDAVKVGSTSGKQRYQCRLCGCYFQLDYIYNACKPVVKQQIVDMTMNGSGLSGIARVLKISMEVVVGTLKKSDS